MATRGYLVLLFLVMTINLCTCHWMGNRDRRMPPPIMSFMDKLRNLAIQRTRREVTDIAENDVLADNKAKESPDLIDILPSQLSSKTQQREKRYVASMRGCHLGTCQIQNLANMLYRLGNNNNKGGSNKDTKDPQGYGRRRRSLLQNKTRTTLSHKILAT
ncbi:pro-adrenomedullin [Bombina bombina]|uniref:pro-adrenomedullin n=1 Tax=Bombina bombina TaxID=8345 RepID=UPI00235ADCA6|nr:pro-adrenomedullin [Bombina bombina]